MWKRLDRTMTEDIPIEMTSRQNDIIAFSLIYTWAIMVHEGRSSFGGPIDIRTHELEQILDKMELSNFIVDAKLKILRGEIP